MFAFYDLSLDFLTERFGNFFLSLLHSAELHLQVASRIRLMSTNTKKANLRTYIGQGTADKIK